MAKFCTKCGKKLEDGKKCDCDKKTEEVVAEVVNPSNDIINDYIEVLKGVFTKPIDTVKEYSKRSKFNLGMIMIVINALVFGLFVYLAAKEGVSFFYAMAYGSYSSLLKTTSVEIPIKVLIIAMLFMLVYFFCIGGLIHFVTTAIFKKESDLKKTYVMVGVTSVITTVTTLIALIGMYIHFGVALFVLALGFMYYLLVLYQGFTELTKIDKNKIAYTFTGCYAVTLFVVCYLLPKIFF